MTEGPTSATSMWTSEPRQPFYVFRQPHQERMRRR
jgi:hypothetical protein